MCITHECQLKKQKQKTASKEYLIEKTGNLETEAKRFITVY